MTLRLTFEQAGELEGQLQHWGYNAVDCVATRQVADALRPRLSERARVTYGFALACQRPAFGMTRRGIRVDQKARAEVLRELERDIEEQLARCAELVAGVWDGVELETGQCAKSTRKDGRHKWPRDMATADATQVSCLTCGMPRSKYSPFNANSPAQVAHLLYDILGLAKLRNKKGQLGTCDKDVLQRLAKKYQGRQIKKVQETLDGSGFLCHYVPVEELIGWEPDEIRDGQGIRYVKSLVKRHGDLAAPLSVDGRYMFSMNIGATKFGRSSSSDSPEKLGGNIQNKAERDRRMFIADPGFEMGNFDLKGAESWIVAYLAEDEAYINAHLHGDVHTANARVLYPDLPWTGDIAKDQALAESLNPPWDPAKGHNYRFQAKRVTHGFAYGLSWRGVARHAKIPEKVAEEAHTRLDQAYPGIRGTFQARVRERIKEMLPLVTPLGREISLLGRPWDDSTFREGYSAVPQSTVADVMWLGTLRIFDDLDPHVVQVLANGHDALLCQWRLGTRAEVVPAIVARLTIPIHISGRTCVIPVDGKAGLTWGKRSKVNPNGLEDCYP